jgi:hypothetical protein
VSRRSLLQSAAVGMAAFLPLAAQAGSVKRVKNAPVVTLPSGVTYQVSYPQQADRGSSHVLIHARETGRKQTLFGK